MIEFMSISDEHPKLCKWVLNFGSNHAENNNILGIYLDMFLVVEPQRLLCDSRTHVMISPARTPDFIMYVCVS